MCVDYYVEEKEWVTICTDKTPVLMNSISNKKKVYTEVTASKNQSVTEECVSYATVNFPQGFNSFHKIITDYIH